jgi:hypothetical protein
MKIQTAAARLLHGKGALALVATATAGMSFAPTAGAKVFYPLPGARASTDASSLQAAVSAANASTDPNNTIVLSQGVYTPTDPVPVITKTLTIQGNHAYQATTAAPGPVLDGTNAGQQTASGLLRTAVGTSTAVGPSLTVVAVQFGGNSTQWSIDAGGGPTAAQAGTLTLWGDHFAGAAGVNLGNFETGRFTETTIGDTTGTGGPGVSYIGNNNVQLVNDTLVNNAGAFALQNNTAGNNTSVTNTVFGHNTPDGLTSTSCALVVQTANTSFSDDATCGLGAGDNVALTVPPNAQFVGGPTSTYQVSGLPTNGGTALMCPTTDERFFPKAGGGCDVGAFNSGAARQTTWSSSAASPFNGHPCSVSTNLVTVPNTQTVIVEDTLSGLGPEAGTGADTQTAPPATPGTEVTTAAPTSPSVTTNTSNINPDDAITNVTIVNGTVAFTPFTAPSTNGLAVQATRAAGAATGSTRWSFTATNWAGLRLDLARC